MSTNKSSSTDNRTDDSTFGEMDLGAMSDLVPIQAVSLAIQDQVDDIRNRAIISSTALGTTYLRWINNPMLSNEYKPIIEEIKKTDQLGRWTGLSEAITRIKDIKSAQSFVPRHSNTDTDSPKDKS